MDGVDGPPRPIDVQQGSLDTAADARDASAKADTAGLPFDTASDATTSSIDGGQDAPAAVDVPIVTDGASDAKVPDAAVDLPIPDAAGTCAVDGDCTDPGKAFCVAGLCTGCQGGIDGGANTCVAPTSVCDVTTGKCVGCTEDNQCAAAKPICDKTKNICATCTADPQCQAKNPAMPACRADGQCVQCKSNTSCSGAVPACDTTTNTCVQCTSSANCAGATPVCSSNDKCQACKTSDECAALKDATRAVCATTGACVQCNGNTDCSGATPACDTTANTCVGCLTSATCATATPICASTKTCTACTSDAQCLAKNAALPGCRSDGQCVQCTSNTQCSGTTPICATASATANTCRACALDSECAGIGPAVCMLDGHCAAETDAIHVGSTGTVACSESNSGSAQAPVCSLQSGVGRAQQNSKSLLVVTGTLSPDSTIISITAPLIIVGKNNATVGTAAINGDAITITRGVVYLRGLTVQGSPSTGMGINAAPTSGNSITLYIDGCKITNNHGGGILINGANFDIENTFITGNGPGSFNSLTPWGGLLIISPPADGPMILNRITIQSNDGGGLSCSGAIQGTGVLSFGNTSTPTQIGAACAISSCTSDGGTICGAS
jgi:hypothetical protein